MKTSLNDITPYITKDGSQIRELMHPAVHGNKKCSLAQAVVEPGGITRKHVHNTSEELYYIVQGSGIMYLEGETFPVVPGDTICILPGQRHYIENTGKEELIIICCCAPPYSHDDTKMSPENR